MGSMLVLLSRPEDIEGRLSELREIATKNRVEKVYLVSVSRAFSRGVRSIVSPHKLDTAARICDEAVSRYLSRIAGELGKEGFAVEAVRTRIPVGGIDGFIGKNNIDLLVSTENFSVLSSCKSRVAVVPICGRCIEEKV